MVAVDLFSGFGGFTQGIERAGFTTIMAANHNSYKIEVHEANHPDAEHWIADLVDPESANYHSARDLPRADLLVAGVSCVNHSQANSKKAYAQGLSLFDLDDPEFDAAVTRSEKDRATANCVLHYAAAHHPRLILVECTTELYSWGPAIPTRPKIGDGSTYRWWLHQFELLGYRYRELYLNSMFFGVPQSRDRLYICMWDKAIPTPDLEHRPPSWCGFCDQVVEAVWTWKTGVPATGSVRYGKQYNYRCPSCRAEVIPPAAASINALDLTDLGTRIGDRDKPLAASTMARAERCRQRFAEFPAVLMPAKAVRGSEKHPWQPMGTQTSQQETALLSTAAILKAAGNTFERPGSTCRTRGTDKPLWTQSSTEETGLLAPPLACAIDNYQGAPRSAGDPLPTQGGSETLGLLSARVLPNRTNGTSRGMGESMETLVGGAGSGGLGVLSTGILPYRRNTIPTHAEPMPTVTAEQIPGLLTAAGRVQCNGSIDEAKYRAYPLDKPLGTVVGSAVTQGVLFGGWIKQNGETGTETAAHPMLDPFGTLTSRDTTALVTATADWYEQLAHITLEDCYFRMLYKHEVGRGCGFDVDFPGHTGTFKVWGTARAQVDGYGNAVSPPVGFFLGGRLRDALHSTH
jgi:site-specific DNA-cytosine methylase